MIKELLEVREHSGLKPYHSTTEWAKDYYELFEKKTPIERAILGGFTTQQLSFAFMSGYQAALEIMFPSIAPLQLKALCVSEAKGVHPKAIQTTLVDNQINGQKTYVTAGSDVEHLIVLCKTNQTVNNRPLLKMVHFHVQTKNTAISDFELSFMKDIKHGKLSLNNTIISFSQILEGDGYDKYTKPFRTLEDICVNAALQAMLLRQAIDYQWDADLKDKIILSIFTLKQLLELPLSSQETILLVATHHQNFEQLLPLIETNIANQSSEDFKTDWEMNKKFLSMGKKLKAIRLMKARQAVFG